MGIMAHMYVNLSLGCIVYLTWLGKNRIQPDICEFLYYYLSIKFNYTETKQNCSKSGIQLGYLFMDKSRMPNH